MSLKAKLVIEWWSIDRVKPYPRNARKISAKAVDKVAASIKEFGWKQPIVVDKDGIIVVGHARRMAAVKLELAEVPVLVAADLTPAQIKAYRLMDNRSHEETDWDFKLLGPELLDIKGMDFDLELTGFSLPELEGYLRPAGDDERANDTPDVPENPISRIGDLWLLGKHRVLCGDATKAEDVARVLGEAKPFLMVTDPPYGVEYDAHRREEYDQFKRHAVGKVANDDRVDWADAYRLFPGDVAYVWHAGVYTSEVSIGLVSSSFDIRAQIIWHKQHFVFGRGAYHWGHEPCWYAVRKGGKANWLGDRKQSTVWDVANLNPMGGNKDESATGHGTQKPVELMRRPILNHTRRGDSVYDPFLGSGTTLIAAEELERVCYGIDIDPKYVDVIVKRWEKYTGKQAGLADDGRTFTQVGEDRCHAEE